MTWTFACYCQQQRVDIESLRKPNYRCALIGVMDFVSNDSLYPYE